MGCTSTLIQKWVQLPRYWRTAWGVGEREDPLPSLPRLGVVVDACLPSLIPSFELLIDRFAWVFDMKPSVYRVRHSVFRRVSKRCDDDWWT